MVHALAKKTPARRQLVERIIHHARLLPQPLRRGLRAVRHPAATLRRREYSRHGFRRIASRGITVTKDALGEHRYQPLYGIDADTESGKRPGAMLGRWEAIQPHLPMSGSAMDIGASRGWFVFKMAEHGLISIGVERDEHSIRTAQFLSLYHETERALFLKYELDPQSVHLLPRVDVITCFSVFHHLVRLRGLEDAVRIMKGLASRCDKELFFETGQYDERHGRRGKKKDPAYWECLAFMGDDPRPWATAFLQSIGFGEVEVLGSFWGFRSTVERYLYRASRQVTPCP
jgi:hypothetical protein